jgi:pyruvate ferredoxin oxidoreductase delta subunit
MRFHSPFEGPWADPEAGLFSVRSGDWRQQRPVANGARCCRCGLCFLYCPTGCISDRVTHFEAELEFCKGCGLCVYICPAAAIAMRAEEGC